MIGKYMNKILDLLVTEFERILEKGFDSESPFYEYIDDLKVVADSLK